METPVESDTVARSTPAPKRRNQRRARKPFDGRFAIGRRVRQLVGLFSERVGPDADDPVMATAIRRCAETVALSEDLRARMLRGESISPDDVLRSSRTADLMTRRLRLDDRRNAKRQPGLSEYLAQRGGQP